MSTIGELISYLEKLDPKHVVENGFGAPDSYRGYYDDVAFAPEENTTVGEMLKHAKAAIGPTFTGYKGGEYVYDKNTDAWLAQYGLTGKRLSTELLDEMVGSAARVTEQDNKMLEEARQELDRARKLIDRLKTKYNISDEEIETDDELLKLSVEIAEACGFERSDQHEDDYWATIQGVAGMVERYVEKIQK